MADWQWHLRLGCTRSVSATSRPGNKPAGCSLSFSGFISVVLNWLACSMNQDGVCLATCCTDGKSCSCLVEFSADSFRFCLLMLAKVSKPMLSCIWPPLTAEREAEISAVAAHLSFLSICLRHGLAMSPSTNVVQTCDPPVSAS